MPNILHYLEANATVTTPHPSKVIQLAFPVNSCQCTKHFAARILYHLYKN